MSKGDSSYDGRDVAIIRSLQSDPMATAGKISKETDIPESTVQKRLKFLREKGTLAYHLSALLLTIASFLHGP